MDFAWTPSNDFGCYWVFLVASARQCLLARAIVCWFIAELTAQDAFCFTHHFEAGLFVSGGVGSVHAFHVLLLRGHKPFAVGRSIDPIRMACRSGNYSSARCVGQAGVPWWCDAKEPFGRPTAREPITRFHEPKIQHSPEGVAQSWQQCQPN